MSYKMTDKENAEAIWLRAATTYDYLSPDNHEMHSRHFEEKCGWLFNEDGSYKYEPATRESIGSDR